MKTCWQRHSKLWMWHNVMDLLRNLKFSKNVSSMLSMMVNSLLPKPVWMPMQKPRLFVRLPVDVVDEDGNTPLSEAACYGEVELVEFFLSRGAHPDSRNELGRTPIWRACYNGHFEIVKLLLENGADKSIASNTGEEPGKQLEKT